MNRVIVDYASEEEGSLHLAISTCAVTSAATAAATTGGTRTMDSIGSDGMSVNSPLGTHFDSSEWSDDEPCFADEPALNVLEDSFRKSWTDSGVSSTRTDSQPGSLANRVKRSSPLEINCTYQDASAKQQRRSQKKRHHSTRDNNVPSSPDAEQHDHVSKIGLPACDGTSTLIRDIATWTPKEREILCQVLENARDLGVTKKLTTPPATAAVATEKQAKESNKKNDLMDYPLSKYRCAADDNTTSRQMKSGKSIMSGLRKISQGMRRRKESTTSKGSVDKAPQGIVYQDYISKYLDPSDESDMSDDEADEISHLANAPKRTGLFKRVFQRRSSRSYLASSGAALKSQRHMERATPATPRLRRERSVSSRSVPDSVRGLFSRSRAQSVESLQKPRRRMPRSRSTVSLAMRSPTIPSSQRFGGSVMSLGDKPKSSRRYDSVRSLLQPTYGDVATHVLGEDVSSRQPIHGPVEQQYCLENVRRRRMSTGQRSVKGYVLDDFFPASSSGKSSPNVNDTRCVDVGYESCYDDVYCYDEDCFNSSHGSERFSHLDNNETIIAPLEIRITQKKIAAKRQLGYSHHPCSFV